MAFHPIVPLFYFALVPGINHPWPLGQSYLNIIDPLQKECRTCCLGIRAVPSPGPWYRGHEQGFPISLLSLKWNWG